MKYLWVKKVKFDDDIFELFFGDIRANEYQRDAINDNATTAQGQNIEWT